MDILNLGVDGVNQIWRNAKLRAVGVKRAKSLYEAACNTIGLPSSQAVRMELKLLLEDFQLKRKQYEAIMATVEELCNQIPEVAKLLEIKGVGLVTAAEFVSEVGNIRRFDSPKQIQKLAGLALTETSSGKHKGQAGISRRGRRILRTALFRAALSLARSNKEFASLHRYYTTRTRNPLKKKQSIIALSCKLIRVFYAILTKGVAYDSVKLMGDIHRPLEQVAA